MSAFERATGAQPSVSMLIDVDAVLAKARLAIVADPATYRVKISEAEMRGKHGNGWIRAADAALQELSDLAWNRPRRDGQTFHVDRPSEWSCIPLVVSHLVLLWDRDREAYSALMAGLAYEPKGQDEDQGGTSLDTVGGVHVIGNFLSGISDDGLYALASSGLPAIVHFRDEALAAGAHGGVIRALDVLRVLAPEEASTHEAAIEAYSKVGAVERRRRERDTG